MIDTDQNQNVTWRESRYGFVFYCFLSLFAGWTALRLALLLAFKPAGLDAFGILRALASGAQRDLFMATVEVLPLMVWMLIVPNRMFGARWHRALLGGGALVWVFAQVFLLFVEFFFFEEFKSRFNTVAVDYLLYPYEVFVNIWESYNVVLIVAVCLGASVAWMWLASRLFGRMWDRPFAGRVRLLHVGCAAALAALLAPTFNLKGARIGTDRTLNEIANNGGISFLAAAWTHHLDYAAFYKTMPMDEAYQRVRTMLAGTNVALAGDPRSIRRRVGGDPARPRLNVVIILEESLGSKFWGCLGRTNSLTPEMDQLAASEGMLFSNLYASGNRTVRGMEGVLSSFPPLPGDSIVKRDRSENVESIARVLKRDGYSTLFLYGGRGVFDGMRSYAVRNGYDRFIEQKHFSNPTFQTIWGVCDEDLFARGIEEFRELDKAGKPFLGTLLTVSNHKPYTYPAGRIPEDPAKQKRSHAVKYADYALGQFFRAARRERFWTNTIFVVVADHGARVYGRQSIPIGSYEIPLLIAGPAVVTGPARIPHMGCSLDVAPTVLGLIGRPYDTMFFGRDLLRGSPEWGRATLNHNRDIGMLVRDRMVVLGLMHTVEYYGGDPKQVDVSLLAEPADADREIERDTIALYQVADDLYTNRRYRIDGEFDAAAAR
jgi:phosphoglycerol transferase MdoB-like AlkP superfamily enzyme